MYSLPGDMFKTSNRKSIMYMPGTRRLDEPGHHDMRHSRKMFPQVKDNWTVVSEAKEKLISRAEQLAATTDWKKGGEEFKSFTD